MGYDKQTWVDNETHLTAARLNHMEGGIEEAGRSGNILNIPAGDLMSGDAIAFNGSGFIKTAQANYLYDGRDAVNHGVMAYTSPSADIGYTLFVQPDGNLDFGTTPVPCALVLSAITIFVDFNPPFTNPKVYSGVMQGLLAMPGVSGYVRIKVHLPEDADGVEIRVKGSAWTEGDDIHTGYRVADITDDTGLYGVNQWYEADIHTASGGTLSDGDLAYIKCFPYAGTVANAEIGENEITSTMGILELEYLPGNISGSTVMDSAGTNDGTLTNVILGSGTGMVADSFDMIAGDIELSSDIDMSGKTIVAGINVTGGADRGFWGYKGSRHIWGLYRGGNICIGGDNNTGYFSAAQTAAEWFFIGAHYLPGHALKVWIDDADPDTSGDWSGVSTLNAIGQASPYSILGGAAIKMTGKMDTIRIFSEELKDIDFENLRNGGSWC